MTRFEQEVANKIKQEWGQYGLTEIYHHKGFHQWQMVFAFPNGYGASVINAEYSTGDKVMGRVTGYELAVMHKGKLTFQTKLTTHKNDVNILRDKQAVLDMLNQIKAL